MTLRVRVISVCECECVCVDNEDLIMGGLITLLIREYVHGLRGGN